MRLLLFTLLYGCAEATDPHAPPICDDGADVPAEPYYFHASCVPQNVVGLGPVTEYTFTLDSTLPTSIEWEIHSASLHSPELHIIEVDPRWFSISSNSAFFRHARIRGRWLHPVYEDVLESSNFLCTREALRTDSHILAWAVREDGSAVCFAFGAGARKVAEANDCVGFYDHAEEQGGGTALETPPPRPD